jgi:Protein of unknown function (DUF3752).
MPRNSSSKTSYSSTDTNDSSDLDSRIANDNNRHSKTKRNKRRSRDDEKSHRRRQHDHHKKSHRRKRKKEESSKRRRSHRTKRRSDSSVDLSSYSSSSVSSCWSSRREERRHDRKGKRKKHDRDEKYYRNDKDNDNDNSMSSHDGVPPGNGLNGHNRHKRRRHHGTMDHDIQNVATAKDNPPTLVDQLHQLFSQYPDLATELPYYLIRMASGSSINLSRVSETDQELVRMLETLFQTMNCTYGDHGNEYQSREWSFDARHGNLTDDNDKALSLVRWVRDELDMFGITMDKIGEYELSMQVHVPRTSMTKGANETEPTPIMTSASTSSMENEIACLTQMVLEEFSPPPPTSLSSSSSSLQPNTLAKELYDILNMIVQHEIVSLDGISDEKLKKSLEQLFLAIGLCREEMEDDSDDDDDQERDKEKVAYGYVMPESQEEDGPLSVQRNLDAAINACKALHQRWMQCHYQEQQPPPQPNRPAESGKRILGPCRPPPLQSLDATSFSSNQHEQSTGENNDEDDEEDDFGPDPFASVKNKRTVSSMSKVRQQEASNPGTMSTLQNNKREEWMMQPGEHDFLKGVLSKGIKSRTFRNEKSKDMRSDTIADAPLDPKIQKQVDDIRKLHEQSRGPSLMEQHRERMEQQKREKQNQQQGGWSWNREKDLDAGRRVDKSHLHMVMGGASSELKNKFQGSYSKTFD